MQNNLNYQEHKIDQNILPFVSSLAEGYTKVESSSINGYSYNGKTETLFIQFTNGTMYAYGNVPGDLVTECFHGKESVGKSFHNQIRGKYQCVRLS
jgi:hypothetical protein